MLESTKISGMTVSESLTSPIGTDLVIVETSSGTRTVPYSKFILADGAAAHNSVYGGRDLTSLGITEICSRISDGSFRGLLIGDYFDVTISTSYTSSETVRMLLAGFNTFLYNGDTSLSVNHAAVVPKNCFTATAAMNSTNTTGVSENEANTATTGAYHGSDMHQIVLPIYAAAIASAIGSSHLLSRKSLLSTAMTSTTASMAGAGFTGASTSWAWQTVQLQLLSEIQVYGSNVCSSSLYDTGIDNQQLPLFALNPELKVCGKGGTASGGRQWYWLKNVASASRFAGVDGGGNSYYHSASYSYGVRPLLCIG